MEESKPNSGNEAAGGHLGTTGVHRPANTPKRLKGKAF